MANGMTHSVIGGLSGLGIVLFNKGKGEDSETIHDPMLATGVGTFFGKLPDILEPALNNPHHRQFCHSAVMFGMIGYGVKKAYDWQSKDKYESILRNVTLYAGVGYLSHLLLDSLTSRTLPLLGKI